MNQSLNYIAIMAFSLFVLTVLFVYSQKKQNIFFVGQLYFQLILVTVAIILISDLLMWMCDGNRFSTSKVLHICASLVYFSLSSVPSFLFVLYTCARLRCDSCSIKRLMPLLLLPLVVNFVLTILSPWLGLFFKISDANVYSRGPLMWLMSILSYLNIFIALVMMVIGRAKISRKEIHSLASFCISPIVSNIFQMIYYGLNIMWPSVALTCLMLYLFSLNDSIRTDPLTGVNNRRQLEQYLYVVFSKKNKKKHLVGIMLDLDNFKSINDKYGHAEGDIALGKAGALLKTVFNKMFISRYAGDEFVVIFESDNPQLDTYYTNFRKEEELFNKSSKLPYTLSFSIGAVTASRDGDPDVNTFIKQLDEKMYEDKRSRQTIPS